MKSLIINSPYDCPARHWGAAKADGHLPLLDERRPAGYEIYDPRSGTRRAVALSRVNEIRERLGVWKAAGSPGITSVTRSLLEHWHDGEARQFPFYFCQLEAVETLIWWVEAPVDFKQGIDLPGDGGAWERLCNKMATGTGKTLVMAMIVTWQVLNALAYPKRKEFSVGIFFVAPGITVRERLQILQPGHPNNYYDLFSLCPNPSLRERLNQAVIVIENWHKLMPLDETRRSVVKKGPESDEAFTRRVLGALSSCKRIVVINDEAHHAYRVPADIKISRAQAEEDGIDLEEATRWIDGLDRLHKTRGILRCFDLSATPFAPTGKKTTEQALFEWILSDFGLNDAIEAGLVKTPRVVVRDGAVPSAKDFKPKLYHLYIEAEVKEDLNRKAEPHEPLPDLVQKAYALLGADWSAAAKEWAEEGHVSPPVMLTVCNRIETAARIEHFFDHGSCLIPELRSRNKTLRVDSRILERAERGETATTDKNYEARLHNIVKAAGLSVGLTEQLLAMKKEDLLREVVDNVGKRGRAGQALQNVISVAMLSEGWDAKNVTHIMGLRAFTSQLLCEQVIGRGLRRVSYDTDANGLFVPEYVNVFGVPLSVFVDSDDGGVPPPPPKQSTQIEVITDRRVFEIQWPNVERIDSVLRSELILDWDSLPSLELDPSDTALSAEMAAALGGQTHFGQLTEIDLLKFEELFRLQRLLFQAARRAFEQVGSDHFKGTREYLLFQLVKLVEKFWRSNKIYIPSLFHQDDLRRRVLLALNMDKMVQHIYRELKQVNLEVLEPVFDSAFPVGSTANMRTWYSTKGNCYTKRSHISHVVGDSSWEIHTANILESMTDVVDAYAKNDHLGFHVMYLWNGSKRRFTPDFLIRLKNGVTLILEIKGQDGPMQKAKRDALDEWVRAVNAHGGFGMWTWDVAFKPAEIYDKVIGVVPLI